MKRRIIEIDREKCNGCGACAEACHEGAIAMVEGKAQLMRDDYCDGLGDCLPACPTGAISFVEREAAAYDEQAVLANKQKKMQEKMRKEGTPLPCGCPGSQSRSIRHTETRQAETICAEPVSRLSQWPVQIKLVPVRAPYFDGAKLLIAADCTAYAYAAFHERFIKGHITLVGCPKLDGVDYAEKGEQIAMSETKLAVVTTASGSLNMRKTASKSAEVIAKIPRGATVTVLMEADDWWRVQYKNSTGWCAAEFLTKQENADNQARMSIRIVDSAGNVFEPVGDFTVKVANADVGDS